MADTYKSVEEIMKDYNDGLVDSKYASDERSRVRQDQDHLSDLVDYIPGVKHLTKVIKKLRSRAEGTAAAEE